MFKIDSLGKVHSLSLQLIIQHILHLSLYKCVCYKRVSTQLAKNLSLTLTKTIAMTMKMRIVYYLVQGPLYTQYAGYWGLFVEIKICNALQIVKVQ